MPRLRPVALAALALAAQHAGAGPADYVFTPTVTKGERELDFKYGAASKTGEPSLQAASLGLGYGATDWWFTEFYAIGEREGNASRFDAFEWENKFQLTETGKYPVDLGLIIEIERPRDHAEGYEWRYGPLLQAEADQMQFNLNPLLTSITRASEGNGTYFGYQWQVKYRWREALEFGAQGFGDLGRWNHFSPTSEQDHRLGPALFGKWRLGGAEAIVWNAALLFGATSGSPNRNFRLQVEYEF